MNLFKQIDSAAPEPVRRTRTAEAEAAWRALPLRAPDAARLRAARVVTHAKADPAHVPFDMLRTSLLQTMRQRGWRSVAVTSPTPACGKTLTCLNLAFSMARQSGARVAVVELDLRRPSMAQILGVRAPAPVERMLQGDVAPEAAMLRLAEGLAFALAHGPVRDSAELLQDERTRASLERMARTLDPDLVIYDLPPMLAADDAAGFLGRADCALLIAAENESRVQDVEDCATRIEAAGNLLGVALNKCESLPRKRYDYGYGGA
ncbi:CpsD/CapB family tyrosine-protein kinase [Oceanicella actignis]|uniref:Chromosome partitioning ATPase, Mrp family, contains Fe-S cluster n=1 Tax=Oceanicella actignis TaxID=1189325 RepID=A0A1M7T562_9RHOB|nr:CpsD/CapB family tyrosine-protein kinase [Oceanicella actignis]SET42772.1 Chromosome partitioning ATPase, Mrp family, contains Fe-S cluster [Oceanicella actignis]SHN65847.1 Chromosome partitioning ATPase, Mrp family, contains Fe-S cluster [Oceanicella actignis]